MNDGIPMRFTSQCRQCSKKYAINDLSIPIVGKEPRQRIVELVSLFTAHLQERHPEELQQVAMAVQDIYGLEVLKRFAHEDPVLLNAMNHVRRAFHRTMLGPQASDAYIQDRVARLSLSVEDQAKVLELCKSLRDYLIEAPQKPEAVSQT